MSILLLSSDSLIIFFSSYWVLVNIYGKKITVSMFTLLTRILAIKLFSFYLVFMSLDAGRMTVNVKQPHSLLSTDVLLVLDIICEILLKETKIHAGLSVTLPEKNDENMSCK